MKKLIFSLVILLLLILFIINTLGINEVEKAPVSSTEETGVSDDSSDNYHLLTTQEKLEDFEYLYQVLLENYPYFEMNQKVNGIDWLALKSVYREEVRKTDNNLEFQITLDSMLKDLNNPHTILLTINSYELFRSLYESAGLAPWVDVLNDAKAVNRYLGSNSQTYVNQPLKPKVVENNVHTEILEEDRIAYIKIKTLSYGNIDADKDVIFPFFDQIQDYDFLLIDIRGNGGGATQYFEENIISKLITEPIQYSAYYLFKGGAFSQPFIAYTLGESFDDLQPISEMVQDENIKNLSLSDETGIKFYYKQTDEIVPKASVQFDGMIFLLIDKGVYSSADKFAYVAKETKFATLVGETTYGGGIGFDSLLCMLPNSGFVFRFDCVMGLTSDGVSNEAFRTIPDIEMRSKDLIEEMMKYINQDEQE